MNFHAFLCLSSILILTTPAFSQSQESTRIASKPEKVTVYLSGAAVESKASSNLKPGMQTVVFDKLSNFIDANSIQVKADADITIMSVNFQLNYLKPQDNKEYKAIEDSIGSYQEQLARVVVVRSTYEKELAMLEANQSIGGANSGVNVSELLKMADFIRSRTTETGLKKLDAQEKEAKLNERIATLGQQIYQLKSQSAKPTGEIVVQLSGKEAGNANFELSYFVTNCGWVPMYDIRVKDVNNPVQIVAKANVYQNTGQEWKNVKLTLSTGNPSRSNSKPLLNPWSLAIYENRPQPMMYKKSRYSGAEGDLAPPAANTRSDDAMEKNIPMEESVTTAQWTEVNTNTSTNALFEIKIPYSIVSNGKDNFVEIQEYSVAANYSYFAIPKLDQDAFLVADLIGWDKGELLPGATNVYFENNYVGKSYFDARIIDDTLSFGLGRDNNITIKRKQVKDLTEKTSITGNFRKITRNYEIEVKNTRKAAITIELEDQIPLSTNAELVIEMLEKSGAAYDEATGKLTWKLTLNPGEFKKLGFSYSVKYPKKYILSGL